MTDSFAVHLPPGFLAEVVAASVLGGHVGAHNKGHDLVDAQGSKVEVKSCSLKPAKDPEFLEIATGKDFPGDCDAVVLVSTSGSDTTGTATVRMSEGVLAVGIDTTTVRPRDQVRAYRLDRAQFGQLVEHGRSQDGSRVTWRVRIENCEELVLPAS